MSKLRNLTCLLACLLTVSAATAAEPRPCLAVLTDIGGDPDDQQSMIRLMVYANEFEIEALPRQRLRHAGRVEEGRHAARPHPRDHQRLRIRCCRISNDTPAVGRRRSNCAST